MSQQLPEVHPQVPETHLQARRPSLRNSKPSFHRAESDSVFHLSPFSILDQVISPPPALYRFNQEPSEHRDMSQAHALALASMPQSLGSGNRHDPFANADEVQQHPGPAGQAEDEDMNSGFPSDLEGDQSPQEQSDTSIRHTVLSPRSAREAYLLLEAARADRKILLARKVLAHQLIHCNTLILQYNRMVLERTQHDLRAADKFVGHVRLMIRKTAAFECAMQEDYTGQAGISTTDFAGPQLDSMFKKFVVILLGLRRSKPNTYHRIMHNIYMTAIGEKATNIMSADLTADEILGEINWDLIDE